MPKIYNCSYPGCSNITCQEDGFCLGHSSREEKEKAIANIKKLLSEKKRIEGVCMSGIDISELELSGHDFYDCVFLGIRAENMSIENASFNLCFGDYSVFRNCIFKEINTRFSSFSGSFFEHTVIEDSNILQTNYNGATIKDSAFKSCDLYHSRFISSKIFKSKFYDCNLKRTYFLESKQEDVKFPYCNVEDAYFKREEKFLI
ncbi:pentapeptide repeat-containing protein [Spirochaetia bacterium 38H-sp]|uniref:Pentapeptide repeat-containing protein n=1 Tax=Rarispira pelagica TaxID=3141764 RepID=A0ABU9UCM5_9SPIR